MKIGILGAGNIVFDFLKYSQSNKEIELLGICALPKEKEKLDKYAMEYGIQEVYLDYDEMLKNEEIEVIYIGVNNHLHYIMTKKALKANKHVICEKPFTSNLKELEELNAVATQKELIILEAITTQYLPNVKKIGSLLDTLGNIKIVSVNYSQYSSRYPSFLEGKILPAFDVNMSGGALMDLNVYNVHLLVTLFGKPLDVDYKANVQHGVDTSGIMTLDYGTFKAVLIGAKDCKAPISTTIQGDKGCIEINTPCNVVVDFKRIGNDNIEQVYDEQKGVHRMHFEFEEFIRIIKEKDYAYANQMMEKSLIAMNIMTTARLKANIIFPTDK